jgi:hypothetical protein
MKKKYKMNGSQSNGSQSNGVKILIGVLIIIGILIIIGGITTACRKSSNESFGSNESNGQQTSPNITDANKLQKYGIIAPTDHPGTLVDIGGRNQVSIWVPNTTPTNVTCPKSMATIQNGKCVWSDGIKKLGGGAAGPMVSFPYVMSTQYCELTWKNNVGNKDDVCTGGCSGAIGSPAKCINSVINNIKTNKPIGSGKLGARDLLYNALSQINGINMNGFFKGSKQSGSTPELNDNVVFGVVANPPMMFGNSIEGKPIH